MFKIDLHTHSTSSHDGGISAKQYQEALSNGTLDAIAITDHNTIEFAQVLHRQLGDRIIVGEEVMTDHGEIIGLFLKERVPAGLSPEDTVRHIKDQGGLVYIPHPFETIRSGMGPAALDKIVDYIDIVEVCNGRAFLQNRSSQAVVWARLNHLQSAASSDAHGSKGLGKTYSDVADIPTRETLLSLLDRAVLRTERPSAQSLLYPKYHKLRKKLRRNK